MRTQPLGRSGIEASVIGLGTWAIGGFMWGGTDERDSIEAIRAAMDHGVTLIDTAPAYGFGLAEELVGKAIKGCRDRVVLATKCGLPWDEASLQRNLKRGLNPLRRSLRPDSIRREVESSLRRLRTDYIDLYQTHWPDAQTPIEDTMGTMLELKEEGKIRAIGVSNVSVEQLQTYLKVGPVDADQERYNMLDRGQEERKLPFLIEQKIAFLAYSPLSMGLLTGKLAPEREFPDGDIRRDDKRFSVESRKRIAKMLDAFTPVAQRLGLTTSQLVLAWTASQKGVTHVLVGARNPRQAIENAGAAEAVLSPEDVARVNAAIAEHAGEIPGISW